MAAERSSWRAPSGRTLWRTERGVELDRFSPDGTLLAGAGPGPDGDVVFYDAMTGDPVRAVGLGRGVDTFDVVWEDDGHLLALADVGRTQALLRIGVDGSVERATDVIVGTRSTFLLGLPIVP